MTYENYLSYPKAIQEAMGHLVDWKENSTPPTPPTPPVPPTPVILNNKIWYTTTDGLKIENTFTNSAKSNEWDEENNKWLLTFEEGVTSIGTSAFYGCSNLTSVMIGNGVTSIDDSAFSECSQLASVTIPNSVTSIGRYAFMYCGSLTSVTIPNNVMSIGESALMLNGVGNEFEIRFESESCEIGLVNSDDSIIFAFGEVGASNTINMNIIVPKGSSSLYKQHDNGWEYYSEYIKDAE